MSAVPAIPRAEDNIENISWPAKMDGNTSPLQPLGKEAKKDAFKAQKHVSKEKSVSKQEGGDVTNGPNHVLRPAKIENMENLVRKPSPGKPFIMKLKPTGQTMIGAYGDGFPQNDKVASATDQKSTLAVNHQEGGSVNCDVKHQKTIPLEENSGIFSNKTSSQTYAKAAQNSSANLNTNEIKLEETVKLEKSDSSLSKAAVIQEPREPAPLMNGDLEDMLHAVPTDNVIKSRENKETSGKTLDEAAGHVSQFSKSDDDENAGEADDRRLLDSEQEAEENEYSYNSTRSGSDADSGQGSKLNSGPLRREAEKPPRMQKQRSQDRLPLKQQKQSFEYDSRKEALSRDSSFECVDSTGVDVHEFLAHKLQNSPRDRPVLLKMEQDIIGFISNKEIAFMKFPPMTSYLRMLVHRVATYFGMDHNVDETGKSVIINKTSSTRLPELRFADLFDPDLPDEQSGRKGDDMRKRSILKRSNQSRSFDRDDMKGGGSWKNRQRSIEERIEAYEKTRARLFKNFEGSVNSAPVYERNGMSPMASTRMALWTDRPWNSTEMDGMRMQGPPPLTTRASSYSSILPRHNNSTSGKTGPLNNASSVNVGMQNFNQGRQPPHSTGPRPPTPGRRNTMGESNNTTYYYMQHHNQAMSYLSHDGYQLVHPGSAGGSGGVGPVQYARYYQMPPPPNHSGMAPAYPRGHNPYEDSSQKGQNANNSDYPMMPSMSTYPHDMSSTTMVYSSSQGQPNISYAYQQAVLYRPTFDPPPMVSNPPSQPGMPTAVPQGKQTPVMQSGQTFVPQAAPPGAPAYPTYVLAQPAGPPQSGDRGPQRPPGVVTPSTVMGQPIPAMHQASPMYLQQGIGPPVCANVNHIPGITGAHNMSAQSDSAKSSSQTQDVKKTHEEELDEKMQAIVLKNMQQQHPQGQMPHATVLETISNPPQTTKPVHVVVASQNLASAATNHQHQYTNANGVPQAQPMQVYLMPNTAPAGGASYRTYSQFVTQPQTPHVMGPGMHFVYLSPPPMGSVDGSGGVAMHPHVPVYQMPAAVPQGIEPPPAHTPNTNNSNNVAANNGTGQASAGHAAMESKPEDCGTTAGVKTAGIQNSVVFTDGQVATDAVQNTPGHLLPSSVCKKVETTPERSNLPATAPGQTQSSAASCNEQVTQNDTIAPATTATESNSTSNQLAPSNHVHQVRNYPVMQHPSPGPVLLGNVPPSYAATVPVSYPPGVVPQYHVYPGGISPATSPYIYLPATAAVNQKQSEARKLYPAKGAQAHSPGLVAVQIPNQIQYVPAASLHTNNQAYFPPHNYIATEYTANQAGVSAQPQTQQTFKQKECLTPNHADATFQGTTDAAAAENITALQKGSYEITEQGQAAEGADAAKPEETAAETAEATAAE